ncbi:hypothetical protein OUZ56_021857 [Daphnia magna]|uniref:Uncharacterized protein n=1 Tax=Daphnia magna TaxID=35525 RepID=A0ABR0AUQ3_9CRUS|nr:hypothetical protein OUZ56_021857 [Daphnia magna]
MLCLLPSPANPDAGRQRASARYPPAGRDDRSRAAADRLQHNAFGILMQAIVFTMHRASMSLFLIDITAPIDLDASRDPGDET